MSIEELDNIVKYFEKIIAMHEVTEEKFMYLWNEIIELRLRVTALEETHNGLDEKTI